MPTDGCGRVALLPAATFNGLPSYLHVVDLKRHLRCDNCGERGQVIVSVAEPALRIRNVLVR
jgi:hypothetical protein